MLIDGDIRFADFAKDALDTGLREVVRGQKHLSLKAVGRGGGGWCVSCPRNIG